MDNLRFEWTNTHDVNFHSLLEKLDNIQDEIEPLKPQLGDSTFDDLDQILDVLLVFDNDKPIACAALQKQQSEMLGTICRVLVNEDYRGKGIAQKLISTIEQQASKRGMHFLDAQIWTKNKNSIRAFEKVGYKKYDLLIKEHLETRELGTSLYKQIDKLEKEK
ncbi:MAG: GNAT family N-acetyltransferase [Firmicutes bacterium]|nr:GNAT family N-acetyltransferase [Bacillota bacterium]